MYVNCKERKNKKEINVYYIYVCESVRIDGKVKNTQRYFGSIKETDLIKRDYTILYNAMRETKFNLDEIRIVEDKLNKLASQIDIENR